jgi:hypothetical protein
MRRRSINFERVARAAAGRSAEILSRWLPAGHREGREWVALNPKRADAHRGSFRVNLHNGLWSDFATGDCGRDLVALAAYLFDLPQDEAARRVAEMVGVDLYD